jgi:hypothetical protein
MNFFGPKIGERPRGFEERGSGGSGAGPVGSGAELGAERRGAWRFGKRQGASGTGRERSSGGPEHGGERGSGTLPLGARFGGPDRGGDASATLLQNNKKNPSHQLLLARNLYYHLIRWTPFNVLWTRSTIVLNKVHYGS